jgi:hypothetical protein
MEAARLMQIVDTSACASLRGSKNIPAGTRGKTGQIACKIGSIRDPSRARACAEQKNSEPAPPPAPPPPAPREKLRGLR